MSVLFAALLVTAPPSSGFASSSNEVELRPYHEINQQLREFLQREALARTETDRAAAVRQLANLYLELKQDPRLDSAPTLQQYKAKLWSRLRKIKDALERQIAREQATTSRGRRGGALGRQQLAMKQANGASETFAAQMALVSYSMGGPAQLLAS